MSVIQVQIKVLGRVQGVGYRYACQQIAKQLQLLGWVRNHSDGSVKILAQGRAANITEFRAWVQQGPALAEVEQIIVEPDTTITQFDNFTVLSTEQIS